MNPHWGSLPALGVRCPICDAAAGQPSREVPTGIAGVRLAGSADVPHAYRIQVEAEEWEAFVTEEAKRR